MSRRGHSPLDLTTPHVSSALIREQMIIEGVGNLVDEVRVAEDEGREEDAQQILRDLDSVMEGLGVPFRDAWS